MALRKGYRDLLEEAAAMIETLPVEQAKALHGQEDVVFVDLRDVRELPKAGKIAGAVHAPRGMLEFWVDPESPYHKPLFAEDKRFVLYCASGWRSALATRALVEMGLEKVCHIEGGFTAWCEAEGPVEPVEKRG